MKRKKNWLKIVMFIIIIALVIFGAFKLFTRDKNDKNIGYVETLEDGSKRNTSEKLKEKQNINGIEISNIQLTEGTDGTITFSATAKNIITEEIESYMFQINLLSDSSEVLGTTYISITNLEPNDTTSVNGIMENIDISKVYNTEIIKLEKVQ